MTSIFQLHGQKLDAARLVRDRAREVRLRKLLDATHEMATRINFAGHAIADVGAAVTERWADDRAANTSHIARARMSIADAIEALEAYQRAVDDAAAILGDQ